MPDLTDTYAAALRDRMRHYVNTTPKIELDYDDYERFARDDSATKNALKSVADLTGDAARTSYGEHLFRDALKRALETVRRTGTGKVRDFFKGEYDQPGLWVADSGEYFGNDGVFTIGNVDIPLRHLSVHLAAQELETQGKKVRSDWDSIGIGVSVVLRMDLDRDATMVEVGKDVAAEIAKYRRENPS